MRLFATQSRLLCVGLVLGLGIGCAGLSRKAAPTPDSSSTTNPAVRVAMQVKRDWDFAKVHFSNRFSGARLNGCEALGESEFMLVISPENTPINTSPMYAFKVWADQPMAVTLRLTNTYSGTLRRPSLSRDGQRWERLPQADYRLDRTNRTASLRLQIGPRPIWVSAVDPIGVEALDRWMERQARRRFVRTRVIGESLARHPLRELVLSETTQPNYVFVVGRQHPPEVTGTIGLMSFVETIAGDTRLARQFRRQFQTVVVPLLNPDGVEQGHWRSNLGAVDLNRDWQRFSQPETAAARDALSRRAQQPGARPFLFVDFHSTSTNVFYGQPETDATFGRGFLDRWLNALHGRCPEFAFERDDEHNNGAATAKAWAGETFHMPSVTCEFGYNTELALVRQAGRVEAEEMMRLLLERVGTSKAN